MRNPGSAPKILTDALPDAALETIFHYAATLPPRDKDGSGASTPAQAIPLVSKRWNRLWNTSQLLWATLNLNLALLQSRLQGIPKDEQDAALASLLHLLRLRGQGARRLWLHSDAPCHLPLAQLLDLMSPNLQQVFVGQVCCHDVLGLLQRFLRLRSLDLPAAAYRHVDWAACPHLLTSFTSLRELTLRDGGISDALLAVVAQLHGLKLLSLTTPEPLPAQFHAQVGKLAGLEELDLYFVPTAAHTLFEFLPAALHALERLRTLYLLAPHSLSECLTIGPGLASLPALQDLQIRCRVERLPPDLWACSALTRLELELKQQQGGAGVVAPPVAGIHMPRLRELRLAKCRFPNSTLPEAFCTLPGLTRLSVNHCGLRSEGGAVTGLPHQFSCLTGLRALSLEGNGLTCVPLGLTHLSMLRTLDLSCNALGTLPLGPYLAALEMISLAANRLAEIPRVLASARACEVLDVSQNSALELKRGDVEDTLLRMPRLGLLLLGKWPGCTAATEWRTDSVAALVLLAQRCPQVEIDFDHMAAEYENLPLA